MGHAVRVPRLLVNRQTTLSSTGRVVSEGASMEWAVRSSHRSNLKRFSPHCLRSRHCASRCRLLVHRRFTSSKLSKRLGAFVCARWHRRVTTRSPRKAATFVGRLVADSRLNRWRATAASSPTVLPSPYAASPPGTDSISVVFAPSDDVVSMAQLTNSWLSPSSMASRYVHRGTGPSHRHGHG